MQNSYCHHRNFDSVSTAEFSSHWQFCGDFLLAFKSRDLEMYTFEKDSIDYTFVKEKIADRSLVTRLTVNLVHLHGLYLCKILCELQNELKLFFSSLFFKYIFLTRLNIKNLCANL